MCSINRHNTVKITGLRQRSECLTEKFPRRWLVRRFFPVIVWYTDCFVLPGQGPLSSALFTLSSDHSWAENLKRNHLFVERYTQIQLNQTSKSLTFWGHNRDSLIYKKDILNPKVKRHFSFSTWDKIKWLKGYIMRNTIFLDLLRYNGSFCYVNILGARW